MVQRRLITSLSQKSFVVLRLSAVSFGPTPIDHLSQPKVIRSIKASRSFVWSDTADPFKPQQNPDPQICGPGSLINRLVVPKRLHRRGCPEPAGDESSLHHAAHAAHAAAAHWWHWRHVFLDVRNACLCGEEHCGRGSCVLQS